jgi:hypothetical protein
MEHICPLFHAFNQDLSNIDTFGLDETSVAKGHDYITLFVDLDGWKNGWFWFVWSGF